MDPLELLASSLHPQGMNLLGVADPAAWNAAMGPQRTTAALFPATRAILVIGNGGPAMWRAFLRDLEADPAHLTQEANPLDAFARRAVREADARLTADPAVGTTPRRWFWAAADAETHIDFRVLARLAGFGQASRLGLLMHDTYGPWLGLRAACFIDLELPFAAAESASGLSASALNAPDLGSLDLGSPELSPHCTGCSRCVSACPGGAFPSLPARGRPDPSPRWAVDICSTYHHLSERCASSCQARAACPVGVGQQYDEAEITYHSNRALGRQWLRDHLGVRQSEDGFDGIGPHWMDWRQRVDVAGA